MSKRNAELLIGDMIASAQKIMRYTEGLSYEQFLSDPKTLDAVIRNFEIIGEAANRLPEGFKDEHPDIEWHRKRGLRNRIVHDYSGIDYAIVWHIKKKFYPKHYNSCWHCTHDDSPWEQLALA